MNIWEKKFEAFSDKRMQLVFIDLPGYGKSGHFIHMEQAETFNAKMKAFLK